MPTLKVAVDPTAKSGFETYDGPTPPVGNGYEGVIKRVTVKTSKAGNPYLNVLVEHDSKDPAKSKYNGAAQWIRVMFGEHNETQARLASFIKAVTGKANKEANIVDTDVEQRESGAGSLVKSIDGVKPENKRVKFDVRMGNASEGYEARLEADFIRRAIDAPAEAETEDVDEIDEDDIEVEGDESEDEDDMTREDREKELKSFGIKDLRAAAKEAEIETAGLKKAELIEALLDWEYEDEDEDDEVEEGEDDEDGVDPDTEDDEEEEDEEEDGEEEDDEDPEAELRAELAGLDRAALRTRLKESNPEAKILKKDSDDDLREKIVAAELSEGDAPF